MLIRDVVSTTLILTLAIAARYLLVVWAVYALVWGRKDGRVAGKRLNRDRPKAATIRHELKLSLLSSWIYALPAALVFELWRRGGTLVYMNVDRYGVAWLFVSGALYLVIQDTYYYWLHRMMHHRAVFRYVHAGHHRSRQPTPFASFSFDWAEAALAAWLMPALTFVIPIHPAVILVLLTVMTIAAVLNHAGSELLPAWLVEGPIGGWLISATHHSVHHTHYGANFGLYFRFWDRAMGTDMMPERRTTVAVEA
jgi:Delta7-sterol 5-desaturase